MQKTVRVVVAGVVLSVFIIWMVSEECECSKMSWNVIQPSTFWHRKSNGSSVVRVHGFYICHATRPSIGMDYISLSLQMSVLFWCLFVCLFLWWSLFWRYSQNFRVCDAFWTRNGSTKQAIFGEETVMTFRDVNFSGTLVGKYPDESWNLKLNLATIPALLGATKST